MNNDVIKKDLIELRNKIETEAYKRWVGRQKFRENPEKYLESRLYEKAKMEQRYKNYNARETLRSSKDVPETVEMEVRAKERQIGDTLDFRKRPPTPEAYKFGTPVGRVYQIPDPGIEIDAFGTGFLISSDLMITNHHVFPYRSSAEGCAINFKHEFNEFGKLVSGVRYKLNPSKFYLSDEKLDFAIVHVDPLDDTNSVALHTLGYIPLIATKGKIVLEDPINIVQYPLGYHKQYATENNFVKDILEEEGYIQYTTDTDESSSGSPAANRHWEVVALHHCGIAMTVNDKVWSKYNIPWDANSMTDADKIYVANEGISISRIVDFLGKQQYSDPLQQQMINAVIKNGEDKILENNPGAILVPPILELNNQPSKTNPMSQNVFNFYNTANVYINSVANPPTAGGGIQVQAPKPDSPLVQVVEKKLRFDETYSNRRYKGYKAKFLGVSIPFPTISDARLGEIYKKEGSDKPLLLNYYHYSLLMNEEFRLQMVSAVNVDYDPSLKTHRDRKEFGDEANSWRADPRIPLELQITDSEFYKPATQIDRGHMVRRDDSCYGNTELEIEFANSDTFHWTNCTPQHEGFNQSKQWGIWGLLENAVKDGLSGDDTKASIFAGPVLVKDEGRVYNDIYYPVKFWKVVAAMDEETGGLLAYGFILDQTKIIDKRGLEAKFDFTQFKTQQVSLEKIEQDSGVVFPDVLKTADIFVVFGEPLDRVIDLESKERILIKRQR
jgi:endonuclease G, mitochondrial